MTPELPDRYGRTELVLMVVDPSLLFAYWEVTSEGLREAQVALGAAHHTFDIDIGLEGRNWYVHLWTAEKSYCADLGFVARTGRFHAITRSNIVHTPRAGVSARDEERWMRVRFVRRRKPDPARRLEFVLAPPFGGRLSPEELRALLERRLREQARLAAESAKGTSPGSLFQGSR